MIDQFETAIRLPPKRLPAILKQEVAVMPPSSALERAKAALAECLTFDQAKDIADEAKAIARYAAEKKGAEELLRMARQIQVRAYRRMGELLRDHKAKFHPVSAESTAIRIAEMDEAKFEQALAKDDKGISPHEFVRLHLPRPAPIYSNDPKYIARRDARLARRLAEPQIARLTWALRSFSEFTDANTARDVASKITDRQERLTMREMVVACQEWLDEFERFLKAKR